MKSEAGCFCCFVLFVAITATIVGHVSCSRVFEESIFVQPVNLTQSLVVYSSNVIQNEEIVSSPQQCSCTGCGCNGQSECPKTIPSNTFVVLSSMEDCSATNQVPGIGLVNIQSTSTSDGFRYYLVDEENKNKAMSNQAFQFSSYKSTQNNDAITCIGDGSASFRYPSRSPGKAYMIARSTNVLLNAHVRFNIQMSCVIPPATSVKMSATKISYSKFYVGQKMKWSFSFVNQFDNVDNWQRGILSSDYADGEVLDGIGTLFYTPSRSGELYISVTYLPHSSVYGDSLLLTTQSIHVTRMATDGKMEVEQYLYVNKPFELKYTIYDDDSTVTPKVDLSKLSFTSDEVELKCDTPTSDYGTGSVSCTSTRSDMAVLLMKFDGKTISASSNVVFRNQPTDNGKNWINYQTAIFAIIILCVIVVAFLVVGGIVGFFVWRRRKTAQRIQVPDEPNDVEA